MIKPGLFFCWIAISIALLRASEECCSKEIKENEQQQDVEENVEEKKKITEEDYKGELL